MFWFALRLSQDTQTVYAKRGSLPTPRTGVSRFQTSWTRPLSHARSFSRLCARSNAPRVRFADPAQLSRAIRCTLVYAGTVMAHGPSQDALALPRFCPFRYSVVNVLPVSRAMPGASWQRAAVRRPPPRSMRATSPWREARSRSEAARLSNVNSKINPTCGTIAELVRQVE